MPDPRSARAAGAIRRWWPVVGFLAAALVTGSVFAQFFDARGHAAGHLSSARAGFPMMAVYAVIVWAIPRQHRGKAVWVSGAVLALALVVVVVGNVRVVNAIAGERWSDAQADSLGRDRPGVAAGHDLATIGMLASVAATILLSAVLIFRRHVSKRIGIAAILVSVLFPPWMIPGAGIIVLAVALCIAKARQHKRGDNALPGVAVPVLAR
jgi:hypothetical protein